MLVSNKIPLLSIVGLIIFFIVILINIADFWVKKEEFLILIWIFGPITTVLSLLWVIFGLIELYFIIKDRKEFYLKYYTKKIDEDNFKRGIRDYSQSLRINGLYLTTVIFQLVYVIINWKERFDI